MPSSVTNEVLDALCPTLAGQNQIYWTSLIGTSYDKCQDSRLVAFADYTRPGVSGAGISLPAPLYTSGSTINPTSGGGTQNDLGYSIINTGDKILYPIEGLSLSGKTITIELGGAVGSQSKIASQTKFYIADFGVEKWFIQSGKNCAGSPNAGKFFCKQGVNTSSPIYTDELTVNLVLTQTPTQMIVGNTNIGTPIYNFPISAIIKKISIK